MIMRHPPANLTVMAAVLCGMAWTPFTSARAQEFEGVISIRFSRGAPNSGAPNGGTPTSGAPIEIQYFTKKGDVRVELGAGTPTSMAGIILPHEKKIYRLISAQSLYMEQDLPDLSAPSSAVAPHVTRTGRKETIAGYECEHITLVGAADTTDVCMTKGLGTFAAAAAAIGTASARFESWQRTLMAEGAFPIKVTQRGITIMEVTKVEKKFLSAALFVVPDSYSRAPSPPKKPAD